MALSTCSEVISFVRKLETDSAKFYEEAARQFPAAAGTFQDFARENAKNIVSVERAYYGVITDAIEGCYAFKIEPAEYTPTTDLAAKTSLQGAVKQAVAIEEKIIKFYNDAGEQSRTLMADVPRAFAIVARKRSARLPKLQAISG